MAAHRQSRLSAARAGYEEILRVAPEHFDALHLLGVIALQEKRTEEGMTLIRRALAVNPLNAVAHLNMARGLTDLRRLDDALQSLDRAIELSPDYAVAHSNRGHVLAELGRPAEALTSCNRAIELRPDLAIAHSNRGNALQVLDRLAEALESCDRAIPLNPDRFEPHNNRGVVLMELGRPDEALASYARVRALKPDDVKREWNESMCRLLMGDYKTGWKQYECRRKNGSAAPHPLDFPRPLWLGDADLRGKTILLHAEQGFGDTLQFVRYAPLVARLGARVLLLAHASVRTLLTGMEGVAAVYDDSNAVPDFDFQCPLMSLPLAFGTEVATIPADMPYLRPDLARAERWVGAARQKRTERRTRMGGLGTRAPSELASGRPTPQYATRGFRTPRGCAWVRFVSLQKGQPAEETQQPPPRMKIADYTDELNDFADTAALVSALDLVISVDTSVVHLTGAIGKPVWILSRFDGCWRWLLDRDDSPWYPTARLFRQSSPGDWAGVVERVTAALRGWAATRD